MDTDTTKSGETEINPTPAAAVAPTEAAPGTAITATTAGETVAEKIDALHAKHFAGSRLGFDTELFNLVRTFTDEVKTLVAEVEALAEKI